MSTLAPVGAVVSKRCTCGRLAQHRDDHHPRYEVEGRIPGYWAGPNPTEADRLLYSDYHLRRLDTGRRHRTSGIVLRDQYVILSLPIEAVMV